MGLKVIPRINGTILGRFGYALERTQPTHAQIESVDRANAATPVEEVDDFRFRSDTWTYSVPVAQLVSPPIFGFGPESWHPLKAAAGELLEDIDTPYESSILRRFYAAFVPESVGEAQQLDRPGTLSELPASRLLEVWTLKAPPFDDPFTTENPSAIPLFGPLGDAEGQEELDRLRQSVMSIRRFGYQPDLFKAGRINVTVLRSHGEQRYLVEHGIHRASVVAAMGATRIDVGIDHRYPWIVDESQVDQWPHVQSGFTTREVAVDSLRRYFNTSATDPALRIAAACHDLLAVAPQAKS